LIKGKRNIPQGYALATGLALKKLFPFLNTVDFTPDDRRRLAAQSREKRQGLRFLLSGGMIIFTGMLLLFTIKQIVLSKMDASAAEVSALNGRIEQVEHLQARLADLTHGLKEMRGFATNRSRIAEIMQDIGGRIPDSVWLDKLMIQPDSTGQADKKESIKKAIQLSGWAKDETQVALFLGNLEKSPLFSEVALLGVERISEDEVWEKSKARKTPLARFSMTANVMKRYERSQE
jgi:Tfp pilus assembly protein PilN